MYSEICAIMGGNGDLFITTLFGSELREELHGVLNYWKTRAIDHARGGFTGRIDGFGRVHEDAPKGIILNTRILWAFSEAFLVLGSGEEEQVAKRAYHYLQNFRDHKYGGVYWALDASGVPWETKKQIYAQAFAIYALCAFYRVSKNEAARDWAIDLFRLIERNSYDAKEGGYLEAFDREWNLLEDLRLSEKDANEKKTMNTHLHVLEAYAALYSIWKDPGLEQQLNNLIRIFLDKVFDHRTGHLNLFFDERWNPKSTVYSFGHDIEASWLMCEAAYAAGNRELIRKTRDFAVEMADTVLREGIDADGGLMNEGMGGKVVDTDKHWWPQAETIVGFINAWQVSGDRKFFNAAIDAWKFTKAAIIDRKNGEWFFRVNKNWIPYVEEDKAGFWKCPYHNSRACMETMRRLGEGC